ncbi:7252_t:CDS:2, partial [Cetraspora pellucida]
TRMPDYTIRGWAEKARMTYQNPETVKYIMSLSKEEIQKEKNKMEGIKKQANDLNEMQITSNKKRNQEEITKEADKDKLRKQHRESDIRENIHMGIVIL